MIVILIDNTVPAVSSSETTTTAKVTVNVGVVVWSVVGGLAVIIIVIAIVGIALRTWSRKRGSVDLLKGPYGTGRYSTTYISSILGELQQPDVTDGGVMHLSM